MWPVCTCSVDYTDIPEREYYVAPRKNRRRRHLRLLPFLLALLLFGSGFLLGRTQAAQMLTPDSNNAGFPTQPSNSANEKCGIIPTTPATTDADTNVNEEPVDNWELVLVNERNPLSKDFSVPKLTRLKNRQSIDSRAYPALQKMMDAARSAGYEPLICSSYRTWDKQNELFQRKVFFYMDQGYSRAEAETQASFWVARPGTSEHQVGLAVDIVDQNYQILDEKQEDTPVQQWLMTHCAEYGFILRYPTEKSEVTGIRRSPPSPASARPLARTSSARSETSAVFPPRQSLPPTRGSIQPCGSLANTTASETVCPNEGRRI